MMFSIRFQRISHSKSDHFGIEIIDEAFRKCWKDKLKSDHFGIEISTSGILSPAASVVKIRPFWDWNGTDEANNLINKMLKSDHFGIEITFGLFVVMFQETVKIRPFWDWNL